MGSGQTVFFKSFDPDDPDIDTTFTVDPNGTAGNDNRGTPNLGTLSAAQATTDSNGVATVEFTVTMQPGDNFMVAASTDSNYLNGVFAVGTSLRDSAGNNLPTNNAKATPMLTVWRQLHMEVDSMGLVDSNRITGSVLGVSYVIACGAFFTCPPGTVTTYLIDVDHEDQVARVDNGGRMVIGGVSYPVVGLANSVNGLNVIIAGLEGVPFPSGTTFTLFDDDDYNENDIGNVDGDEGEDVNAIEIAGMEERNTFSLMRNSDDPARNIYAAAYIRPVYDGAGAPGNTNNQTDEIFFVNIPRVDNAILAQFSQGSKNNENDAYWVAYVQLCYQGDQTADNDPNSEPASAGISATIGPSLDVISSSAALEGAFGTGSLIYLETMRDVAVERSNDARKRSVPHEVGHQFGIAGDNEFFSFGIMNPEGEAKFVPMHLNLLRWRVHSP